MKVPISSVTFPVSHEKKTVQNICNDVKVFTVTLDQFNVPLRNENTNLKRKPYWLQTFEQWCIKTQTLN